MYTLICIYERSMCYFHFVAKRLSACIVMQLFKVSSYGIFSINIQSNQYIKATQLNLKMWPLRAVALYMQGKNNMYYSLMGEIRLSFIDSDLLYRGAI
jgi:hypothetical protein